MSLMMSLSSLTQRSVMRRSTRHAQAHIRNYSSLLSNRRGLACSSSSVLCDDRFSLRTHSTTSAGSGLLGRTLYRQLLRWCQDAGDDIPLAQYVPPVTIMPPIVDEDALKGLSNNEEILKLLPSNVLLEDNQMTVPLRKASDIRNFFRAVYRMNNQADTVEDETQKQRVNMAFETLKSINELTGALDDVRAQREKHLDRDGIKFCVGQVVQHKKDRWRGVVLEWDRISPVPEGQLSSLTTKDYSTTEEDEVDEPDGDRIRYTMILDSGDAHLLGGRRQVHGDSGYPVAFEKDLETIQDLSLCRIRSHWIANYFDRFDATSKCFVPKEARQYEYPLDEAHLLTTEREETAEMQRNEIGFKIMTAIQLLAARLERTILKEKPEGLPIVEDFRHRLHRLSTGDVLTDEDRLTKLDITESDLAALHLRWFLTIALELAELLWQRRIAKESIDGIQFRLGDIVRHKKYDFRGVVVAWDAVPSVDVSRWDGLGDIENPSEKPFYHIIPDQRDCIQAFGAERPFRYVCEDNLELCPREKSLIDVDMDLDWDSDTQAGCFIPPEDLRFKYGEELDDVSTTEKVCEQLYNDISELNLAQRGLRDVQDDEISQIGEAMAIEVLFKFLKLSNNMDVAVAVEEYIKELWKAHPSKEMRTRLDSAIAELLRGNKEKALIAFQELTNDDPLYAEAWNKASTCYFMLGDMQASMEAAEKALLLLPQHFQAMNGLGLIQYETRRYKMAAGSFRESLSMDPWSPVSSRLAACLDLLHGLDLEEEQGAAEGTAPYE